MNAGDDLYERLRANIGKTFEFTAPDELGRPAIRQFALALGDFNPVYTDRAAAEAAGLPDVMAPPTFVCETMQYLADAINERGDFSALDGVREPGGLRAGNDYEFIRPVHPDDVITARWELKDVYRKDTRSGSLVFTITEITYRNQRGEILAVNREHMFHRV
ncbi:MAG TPA: MaoC family dehydratase N-terminal domain-containing protein [Dehalococcoidia bacterium]|nr:MaoC family dehydratase N-terminal domain-containing protein [Dehalococcoidia bacterium]